jgi:hypothetical protein
LHVVVIEHVDTVEAWNPNRARNATQRVDDRFADGTARLREAWSDFDGHRAT